MEFGDPPGRLTVDLVRRLQADGHIIASGSDRTVAAQWALWRREGIELDQVVLKHLLSNLRDQFTADEYWHIGDNQMDFQFATQAEFIYVHPNDFDEDYARNRKTEE